MKVCRRGAMAGVLLVAGTLASPGGSSVWAGATAQAQTLGRPGGPSLRAASTGPDEVKVCPERPSAGNLLSPDVAGMDSVEGWPARTNADLEPSSEQAVDGAGSLELTALARGSMSIGTAAEQEGVEVVPGYTYGASAELRANHKLRPVGVAIGWYDAEGEALGVSAGESRLEAAGEWTLATHLAVAPKGAAYASLILTVDDAFKGEKHYADAAILEASLEGGPVCDPEDGEGPGDGEPGPGDGDDGDGGNGGNGDGGNDDGDGGNGGNGGGGNGSGNGGQGQGGGEAPAGEHPVPGTDEPDDDAPTEGGNAGDSPKDGGPGEPNDGNPSPPAPAADAWHPAGTYSTASLMTAALRLKALGWSEEAISRKVFAPFIVGGEAGWTETWGAPRSGGRSHEGQDVFCNYGDPVLAAEDGTVEFDEGGLGGRVARLHRPDGSYWYYAHLSDWNTEDFTSGDGVTTGDVIGYCGNTGNAISTPPHVHFGLYSADGAAVNPMRDLVGWLEIAQKRTLGYVDKITRLRVREVERLTSARRFGDGFTPTPSEKAGASDILLASRSLRMFSALQAALSRSGADLEATDSAGDLVDPDLLHFELWLTSNELPPLGPAVPAVQDAIE